MSEHRHDWVHIGDSSYTLKRAMHICQQYECKHCGAFSERIAQFLDFRDPFEPDELARRREEETAASPIERRKRERAAGQMAIGEPCPILYTPPSPVNPAWRALGDKLRAARMAKGWGLLQLSTATAIGPGPLSQMQHGRVLPTPEELDVLASVLHLTITAEDWALVGSAVRP